VYHLILTKNQLESSLKVESIKLTKNLRIC